MISTWVGKRIQKAYPKAVELIRKEEEAEKGKVFAAGCGFYKIVLLFFVRSISWRYYRDDFLQDHGRCVDEPIQCSLGTVQYCLGTGDRTCDSNALQI